MPNKILKLGTLVEVAHNKRYTSIIFCYDFYVVLLNLVIFLCFGIDSINHA